MRTIFIGLMGILVVCIVHAQETPKSLLNKLPPIPESVCAEISEVRVKFVNDIREVEMKIEAILQEEKEAREKEELRCEFNLALFQNESLSKRMTAIAIELEQLQTRINEDNEKPIREIIEIEEPIVRAFDEKMFALTREYWDLQKKGDNVEPIREKIKKLLIIRCETLSETKLKSIQTAYDLLLKNWSAYERMNELQYESARISFIGYSLSVQNGGLLLEEVKRYLQHLYDAYYWHPSARPMDELGNDDGFY